MILCPLCKNPVYKFEEDSSQKSTIEEGDTDNFFCYEQVRLISNRHGFHYQRRLSGVNYFYTAYMPPFKITYKDDGCVAVDQIISQDSRMISMHTKRLYESTTADFNDFVKLCDRFKNMVAFS
jgi:hypothetical protein